MSQNLPPSQPNLFELKSQAKDLSRAYCAGDPDAIERVRASTPPSAGSDAKPMSVRLSLQEAQRVVAREHGQASWGRLKWHVETLREKAVLPMAEAVDQFKKAVGRGDVEAVRTLLEASPAVRSRIDEMLFPFDTPALVVAKENRPMVDLLLDHGANINAKSTWWAGGYGVLNNTTPDSAAYLMARGAEVDIHAAVEHGLMDRVKELITADPSSVHRKGPDGQRPLHFAKAPELMDYLLQHGADIDARCVDHLSTAAQYAINDPERLRHLLERGAEPDLFMACALGDRVLAGRLIDTDPACLDAHTPHGLSPRELGVGYPCPPTPEHSAHLYLWELGLNVTPYLVALKYGHTDLHKDLIARSSPRQRLLDACSKADRLAAAAIIAQNPNVDRSLTIREAGTLSGRGLYEYYHGKTLDPTDALLCLLEAGFDIAVRSEENATPLHWAAWYGCTNAVNLLLERGAPLEATGSNHGGTPLGWACHGAAHGHHSYGGHLALIRRLLDAGADRSQVSLPTGNRQIDELMGDSSDLRVQLLE